MVRTNQGGLILRFVIIGGVMALLLIGGAYLARLNFSSPDNGRQATNTEESSPEVPSSTTPDGSNKEQTENNTVTSNPTPSVVVPSSNTPSTGLPETGPSNALLAGVMLSTVAGLFIAYKQSRSSRFSL